MAVGPLRFFHVNVNCSDLERSLGFYRDLVGLQDIGSDSGRSGPSPVGRSGWTRCSGMRGS